MTRTACQAFDRVWARSKHVISRLAVRTRTLLLAPVLGGIEVSGLNTDRAIESLVLVALTFVNEHPTAG